MSCHSLSRIEGPVRSLLLGLAHTETLGGIEAGGHPGPRPIARGGSAELKNSQPARLVSTIHGLVRRFSSDVALVPTNARRDIGVD